MRSATTSGVRLVLLALMFVAALPSFSDARDLLAPGEAFPAWTLRDHTGTVRSSVDLAGESYFVWFYPKAMTPGCTAEGRGLRDVFEAFEKAGVAVLGVSFDEPAANAAFVEAEGFPFPLLSDTERTLAIAVGAADDAEQGYARRISYLVGRDGKVIKTYAEVDPVSHAAEVLRDLAAH